MEVEIPIASDESSEGEYYCLEIEEKPLFLKELKNLWEKIYYKGQYSASNTLLIDDEPHTALLNPPNTAIFPKPYKKRDRSDNLLGPDGELRKYLDGLADAEDVPSYVKDHQFGQPAITPSHPNWDYYSRIVRHFGKKYESVESSAK